MFEGQPKGLFALALANTGERFGYYTMLAVFALFLRANYGLSPALAGTIYSSFLLLLCLLATYCCRCLLVVTHLHWWLCWEHFC